MIEETVSPEVLEDIVRFISDVKDEPQWMRERRLKALELFERKPMPAWGPRPVPRGLRRF